VAHTTKKAAGSTSLQTPLDLFLHELSDIRSAETIVLQTLDEAIGAVSNAKLKKGLEAHRTQTEGHVENIDKVFELLEEEPEAIECKGMKGLHEEAQEAVKSEAAPEILDSLIASGAQKIEHYEIVSYEGLVDQAKSLGNKEAATLLRENLKQEKDTLTKLEEMEPTLQSAVEKLG